MRQSYTPNQQTHKLFRNALHNDLGIYSVQSGGGLGGFLKNAFSKYIIPIGKSLLSKGYEIAKPELQKIAQKGINSAAEYGIKQINTAASSVQK